MQVGASDHSAGDLTRDVPVVVFHLKTLWVVLNAPMLAAAQQAASLRVRKALPVALVAGETSREEDRAPERVPDLKLFFGRV